MIVPPRLCLLEVAEKCSSFKMFQEVYKHIFFHGVFYVFQIWSLVFLSIITFFSWKTALLKAYHSPSKSSLLIIAKEEYVTP